MTFDRHTELQLLEALEEEPETSQADLAARIGVAVGTVNWYMKRWSKKGYVIVKRLDRWRWRYLLTPQGMAEKTVLARKYVEASVPDLVAGLDDYFQLYNYERPHQNLGCCVPAGIHFAVKVPFL